VFALGLRGTRVVRSTVFRIYYYFPFSAANTRYIHSLISACIAYAHDVPSKTGRGYERGMIEEGCCLYIVVGARSLVAFKPPMSHVLSTLYSILYTVRVRTHTRVCIYIYNACIYIRVLYATNAN